MPTAFDIVVDTQEPHVVTRHRLGKNERPTPRDNYLHLDTLVDYDKNKKTTTIVMSPVGNAAKADAIMANEAIRDRILKQIADSTSPTSPDVIHYRYKRVEGDIDYKKPGRRKGIMKYLR